MESTKSKEDIKDFGRVVKFELSET